MSALLDTHILLWWLEDAGKLSSSQAAEINEADEPVLVSDITLWEIAMLENLGRISLALPLREWLEAAVAPPRVQRQGISPPIAAGVAALPETFHRDPADRILVATARTLGASLVTSDQRIADSGLVPVIG